MAETSSGSSSQHVYSPVARRFHWWTVAFVAVLAPVGLYMSYRGNTLNQWDATTNALYSGHKLAGLLLLLLVIARLGYRLVHGAPADEPTLEGWQKAASHVTHWTLYGLLILIPILGWLGVSRYPALEIFGRFELPALVAPDKEQAEAIFNLHKLAAYALIALVALHIAAALFHYVVRKDGVLARMLPSLAKRDHDVA
jgi:cytochrome b561